MIRVLAVVIVVCAVLAAGGSAAITGPPAPTNLEVISVTKDTIAVAWGPSQPGEFYPVAEGKSYVTIAWGLSQDSRGPLTYTLSRDGKVIASKITTNTYRLPLAGRKTFRTCVTAYLADGRSSPPMCATWSRA